MQKEMSINRPPKLIIIGNILVGLYFGFIFFMTATWGIDDDAELAKVAWGHIAVHRFQESAVYAAQVTLACLGLTWLSCFVLTRNFVKTTKWAVGLAAIALFIILSGAAIGCVHFYIKKLVGP
jgi:hypothetical protein